MRERKEFRIPDWELIKEKMKIHLFIDGRNVYIADQLKGINYLKIG